MLPSARSKLPEIPHTRFFPITGRWSIHSYNSLCPYAPDGSGRIVTAGADLDRQIAEVLLLSPDGEIMNRFGEVPATPSFWHTGLWQSWSGDGNCVYFQSGTHLEPFATRYNLQTGESLSVAGDLEGIPPSGEPGISGSQSLLYAAGYGDGKFKPEMAPVPFLERDRHGINEISFDLSSEKLILSTQQVFDLHPERKRILKADAEVRARLGANEGLTLMTYCVRWNRQGTRFLFYWGNHCVVGSRGEPKISYVFTSDRKMQEIRLAVDLSFGRRGTHWSWQPDGETLIGYGPRSDGQPGTAPAEVRYDGTGYRTLCDHTTGRGARHPSVSPANRDLVVTDEINEKGGAVVFLSSSQNREVGRVQLPKFIGDKELGGRNPLRVCHHPVFNLTGDRVLVNTLPGPEAVVAEIDVAALLVDFSGVR
jgi:hypothetical protein